MALTAEQLNKKSYYQKNREELILKNKLRRLTTPRKYNPEANRRQKLKSTYGLSWEEYTSLYNQQEGKCQICHSFLDFDSTLKAEKPFVDHNHTTGEVRGLLCCRCNFGLGQFKDSPYLLESAINYLKKYNVDP